VEEAAAKLAAILREEQAAALTIYDDNGNYGHPDHIQVHRVGMRAAELAGTPRVYQQTMNRDYAIRGMQSFIERATELGIEIPDPRDFDSMGKPEAELTAAVDVSAYVGAKRAAMRAHASQISDQSDFLSMPEDAFTYMFGIEWAIRAGQGPGITETDLMAGL